MNINAFINLVWMQALWFAAVMGAAAEQLSWAVILLTLFVCWTFTAANRVTGDFKLILVSVLLGLILDTTWIKLGWLDFSACWPATDTAPLWILILWAGLALTLNHSLAWLQSRLLLAGLLGGISSPLSYLAASKLGAVTIVAESWQWVIGIGLSWAMALPFLLWLAQELKQLSPEAKEHV